MYIYIYILKFFSKIYRFTKKHLTKISSNLTENAFDFSLFHTFEQQWYFEGFLFLFFIKRFVNNKICL